MTTTPERPSFVILRYKSTVYLVPGEALGDPLPERANEELYARTRESPFLDGLAFAGAYTTSADIGIAPDLPSNIEAQNTDEPGSPPPPPR